MKKLIFNGCSFMAGDALVWDQYQKEHNREHTDWNFKKNQVITIDDIEFRNEYIKYRQKFNLPAKISKRLECEWIDLSSDGKSNESIAMHTIAYINSLPKEERKNYHVIIGWTSISRIMKYSSSSNMFLDLTAGHYDEHTADPAKEELKDHIKTRILGGDDQDFILDYVRNIMLLENYLIVNDISYTFFRSLDDLVFDFETIGPFQINNKYILQIKDCTNHENWFKFVNDHRNPINGVGWGSEFFKRPRTWITPTNTHPGLEYVNIFSVRLSNFIKKQQVL